MRKAPLHSLQYKLKTILFDDNNALKFNLSVI